MTYYMTDETISGALYRVAAGGEVDLHARSGLEERMERAVASGARLVALDLSDATFVDSTAVRAIFEAHSRLQGLGRRLVPDSEGLALYRSLVVGRAHRLRLRRASLA
jgi:anti-anti-sigma factor